MRYFSIGGKATIKITDDKLTLEEFREKSIKEGIISESEEIKEIDQETFIKPIDEACAPKLEYEDTPYGKVASWNSVIKSLRK
jgi:hypothetical protein